MKSYIVIFNYNKYDVSGEITSGICHEVVSAINFKEAIDKGYNYFKEKNIENDYDILEVYELTNGENLV